MSLNKGEEETEANLNVVDFSIRRQVQMKSSVDDEEMLGDLGDETLKSPPK